jgi:HD-like signal output (HDOD) protein
VVEKNLTQLISESLARKDLKLPVFNRVALRLQEMIGRNNYGAQDIADLIQQDQALTSHILKVANSSFYMGLSPVKTLTSAATRLGGNTLVTLAHVVTQRDLYRTRVKQFKPWIARLWSHALGVAVSSKWLAQNMGYQTAAEEAFMAGLLHDIGKLLLMRIIDELMVRGEVRGKVSVNLVREIMADMHAEYGRIYLETINMPESYSKVAGDHHSNDVSGENVVLNLVRLGNMTCHKLGIGMKATPGLMLSTTPEALNLMAKDILLAELQVHLEEHIASVNQAL